MRSNNSVLYVDDEPINLTLFELTFKNSFSIVTASSGELGLKMLDSNPNIGIVISDMRMPRMNGLEFIAQAKRLHPHVAFYILTGFDITDEIDAALSSSLINRYFRKPFNFKEVAEAINDALRS